MLPASARADTRVELDPATDTVRVAANPDGALTGPASGAAAPIGLRYVRAQRARLGLTAADLDTLAEPTVKSAGGIRQVRWRQEVDGIAVADAELRVNVDADGRVINVLGSPSASLPQDTSPLLAKPEPDAELTIYSDRLAYRYRDEAGPDAIYDTITDADTGKVLKRTNLVKSAATANVWENHPSLVVPAQTVDLTPWLASPGATTLDGPWVHAYVDVNGNNTVTETPRNAQETFEYPFVHFNTTGVGCTNAKPCSWNGTNASRTTNRNQNAVQAFFLANRFRDHLAAAPINFDGFSGADKVLVETNNGNTNTNNANMYTPPEGQSPRMQMYFWSGTNSYRSVNSGDDASILFHEYTHGLTGRLVTDADGVQALGSWQAGAMGEGWSDFYAKDYLVSRGLETDTGEPGEIDMGAYMDATAHSTRHAGLDCPVGSSCPGGGYTYADFAVGGPEFHADGEIWAQTLWDLRTRVGSVAARRLVTDALRLSPPEPSFLDMRNAILQADAVAATPREFEDEIWDVFAARGMGVYATTTGGADTKPVENYARPSTPGGPTGTVTGTVVGDDGPLAGIVVGFGGPQALETTTGADGRYTITGVPVQEDAVLVVRGTSKAQVATGFEQELIRDVDIAAGATVTKDATLRRNWASVRSGAVVQSTAGNENAASGCGPQHAVDGLPSSTWSTTSGGAKALVVRLPRTVDVSAYGVDPGAGCGDDERAATQNYTVALSSDGTNWTTTTSGTFTAADNHRMNRRALAANGVQYVRITPTSTQGGAGWIDVSEFAVYGTPSFEARILSGPTATGPTATFTFTGLGTTGFECSLDGAAFETCESPKTYTDVRPDGPHQFRLRGVNGTERTPIVARDFTVTTQLPETTLTARPPALTNAATVTFDFTGTGSGFQCSLDGAAFSACASGQPWPVTDGTHRFLVRAVNTIGPDPTPAEYAFSVDTLAPETIISWAPPPILTTRDFAVAFMASEAATFVCSVDGAAAAPCASPLQLTGLGEGAHSVVVTATDAAGNVDPTPARSDFTVIIPALPPAPSPTPTATPAPKAALTSATVAKTASLKTLRKTGKLKITLGSVSGARVTVQAKVGSRVIGTATRTRSGTFQLTLSKSRLRGAKVGNSVVVRLQASGNGLKAVTRTLKVRLKA